MLKEITVKLNLTKRAGNVVAAIGDVTLDFAEMGSIKLCGFRVLVPDGKPLWVAPPARHGERAWFDTIVLQGAIKKLVTTAVVKEYEQMGQAASRA
jgi:DNA-binding cell septation regulator SpoVG